MSGGTRSFLGFDYGARRIGVAIGQELTRTAEPLTTLAASAGRPDWVALDKLVAEWRPDALVVGLPLNMDGTEHEVSEAARRFGNRLQGRYNLPVHLVDERLSSIEAESHLRESRLPKQKRHAKEAIDQVAARLILESWLAQL